MQRFTWQKNRVDTDLYPRTHRLSLLIVEWEFLSFSLKISYQVWPKGLGLKMNIGGGPRLKKWRLFCLKLNVSDSITSHSRLWMHYHWYSYWGGDWISKMLCCYCYRDKIPSRTTYKINVQVCNCLIRSGILALAGLNAFLITRVDPGPVINCKRHSFDLLINLNPHTEVN